MLDQSKAKMTDWSVTIEAAREDDGSPIFVRIARAITADIRRGRLRAGDALPGTRTLATSLGVHRNTVLAAYRELFAEGWISSAKAKGTYVSVEIPEVAPKRFSPKAVLTREIAARAGYDVESGARGPGGGPLVESTPPVIPQRGPSLRKGALMTLGGGMPDVRLVPAGELARAFRRVLRRSALEVLSYGEPQGPVALRAAIAKMVSATRGVAARAEHVLVARGSQMGIDLVARTLIRPGDVVAVEHLGYRPAWEALRAGGARLVPVPVDAHGIDVGKLERLADAEQLRGVYVTPHHQFPTTVTLAPARRLRLLDLAREKRFWILEDDYDHEFHYEGRPVLPLASADVHGVVLYVGTFSKVLAPGMRIGFVVAPVPIIDRLATTRRYIDRQGDHLLAMAVAELLEEGDIQRHIRRAKRIYAERRVRFARLLETHFSGVLSFELPSGGTAIWARVSADVPVDLWAKRALEAGLVLQPARLFSFDGKGRSYLRLGFAQHDEREAKEAIGRMARAIPRRARASG